MASRRLVPASVREALLGIPSAIASLERNYLLADDDLDLIGTRRRPENRLGLALHIALLRHPRQGWHDDTEPPAPLVAWLAEQIEVPSRRVYPRTRGGTRESSVTPRGASGLSPHTRGNHLAQLQAGVVVRSIPAHAGEPRQGLQSARLEWVYPRTRGGTPPRPAGVPPVPGLSPHTRGNRGDIISGFIGRGSIPAHAGEPRSDTGSSGTAGVYPRTRGGTYTGSEIWPIETGLSPHTRGNPCCSSTVNPSIRSIPAHAGEPGDPRSHTPPSRVYPRTRGGTAMRSSALRCR